MIRSENAFFFNLNGINWGGGGGERERDRQTDRQRQRQRETDRQTDRQIERETGLI